MSERVEAGLPANNSGAMYICVPVCDDEPGPIIVCVNPARVIPDRYSSESTWPMPKSVSLAWINFGFRISDCEMIEDDEEDEDISLEECDSAFRDPHSAIKMFPGFTSRWITPA